MDPFTPEDKDSEFEASLTGLRDVVGDHMEGYAVSKACDSILEVIASVSSSSKHLSPLFQPLSQTGLAWRSTQIR